MSEKGKVISLLIVTVGFLIFAAILSDNLVEAERISKCVEVDK